MNREIQSFLDTLEEEIQGSMHRPIDLQLLNWLDGFLKKVWDAGYNEAKKDFNRN